MAMTTCHSTGPRRAGRRVGGGAAAAEVLRERAADAAEVLLRLLKLVWSSSADPTRHMQLAGTTTGEPELTNNT